MFQGWHVRPFFRWYDLWIGAFIDTKKCVIYICPVPMFGFYIMWPMPPIEFTPPDWEEIRRQQMYDKMPKL